MKKRFLDFLGRDEILSTTPSFHVRAFHAGQQAIDVAIGESFKFYDIASLTKIVYTTTRIMELVDQSMLDLDVDLKEYLGESYSGDSSLRRLLTHSAGHGWWKAFYEELLKDPTANHSIDTKLQWQKMEKLLKNPEQEKEPDQFVYSDIDFLLLGWVLRAKLQTSLEDDFQRFKKRWGLENTFFSVNNICPIDSENVAPTEYSEWREKRMQGQVHDENTYALGGVSSHAGLISTMDDLSRWALKIRAALLGEGPLSQKTMEQFSIRQTDPLKGDWGLGFMKPTKGSASCGRLFSPSSFGHTGFTGTSIWFDPEQDIIAICLSNRVYLGRDLKGFVKLRPKIHDAIVNTIQGEEA